MQMYIKINISSQWLNRLKGILVTSRLHKPLSPSLSVALSLSLSGLIHLDQTYLIYAPKKFPLPKKFIVVNLFNQTNYLILKSIVAFWAKNKNTHDRKNVKVKMVHGNIPELKTTKKYQNSLLVQTFSILKLMENLGEWSLFSFINSFSFINFFLILTLFTLSEIKR